MRRMMLSVLLAAIVVFSPAAQTYRILVTNDDGIRAPGILALARAMMALGEVTVVAPADNQSGKGHSLTLLEPIFVDKATLEGFRRRTRRRPRRRRASRSRSAR
jgi:hypothetical protein